MQRFCHRDTAPWTIALVFAMVSTSAFSAGPLVVIDRIEASSHSDLSSSESAALIEIPTGVELSQSEVGTKLQETKVALEASGKFSDVELRLGKSTRPQHFVLTTDLKRSSDHYFGVGAEVGYSPYQDDWGCACSVNEKMQYKKARLNAYTGNRNFLDSGWALDLDLLSAGESGSYSNTVQQKKYSYNISQKNEYATASLNATAIQQDFLSGHGYAGGLLSVALSRIWSSSIYDFQSDNKSLQIIHADHAHAHDQNVVRAGLVAGVRAHDFTLGVRWSRTRSALSHGKDNEDSYMLIDGKLQPPGQYFTYNSDYGPNYRNEVDLTLAYSEKPLLNLVEYGLDTFISWQRFYKSNMGELPNIYAHIDYTWKISDPIAFTYLLDGIWRHSDLAYIDSSMQRILQMGGRIDYIQDSGLVLFGQFNRSGVKRNEVAWVGAEDSDLSGYVMRSRADIGIQYASPEFLYSFSFIYGAEPISEIIEMNRKQFARLGVH